MKRYIALMAVLLVLPLTSGAQVLKTQADATASGVGTDIGTSIYVELGADGETTSSTDMPVTASAQVHSEQDLAVFEQHLQIENTQVAEVSSGENIALEYYHEGHLFGFLPLLVKSKTVVTEDAQGDVMVKTTMPWWNIFVTGTDDVAVMVDAQLEASLSASVDASARARAHALEAIADAHAKTEVRLSERE